MTQMMANAGAPPGGNVAQNNCEPPYEKCRTRGAVHGLVTAALFGYAVFRLATASQAADVEALFHIFRRTDTKAILMSFHSCIYLPFVVVFGMHLFRIYVTMLIIEEDPEFYYHNQRRLKAWQRGVECVIRVIILGGLLWFVERKPEDSPGSPGWLTAVFAPALFINAFLVLWDISMLWWIGVKQTFSQWRLYVSRISFLVNDIIGLIMSLILVCVGVYTFGDEWLIPAVGLMLFLALIAVVSFAFDLMIDRGANAKKYATYLLHLWHYTRFPCCEDKPLSEPCPCKK